MLSSYHARIASQRYQVVLSIAASVSSHVKFKYPPCFLCWCLESLHLHIWLTEKRTMSGLCLLCSHPRFISQLGLQTLRLGRLLQSTPSSIDRIPIQQIYEHRPQSSQYGGCTSTHDTQHLLHSHTDLRIHRCLRSC
jgi:hypothetical protein